MKKLLTIIFIGIICIHSNVYASSNVINQYASIKHSNPLNIVYQDKEHLFNEFFTDFYNYIVSTKNGQLSLYAFGINNVNDFLNIAKTYSDTEAQGMPWIGNIAGNFFARPDRIQNLYLQTAEDGFIGYCLENNKYVPQIKFFIEWFANLRTDEGLVKKYGHSVADFLDFPHDTLIDVCKLFYFNRDNCPDFLKTKGYVERYLENIPGVMNY